MRYAILPQTTSTRADETMLIIGVGIDKNLPTSLNTQLNQRTGFLDWLENHLAFKDFSPIIGNTSVLYFHDIAREKKAYRICLVGLGDLDLLDLPEFNDLFSKAIKKFANLPVKYCEIYLPTFKKINKRQQIKACVYAASEACQTELKFKKIEKNVTTQLECFYFAFESTESLEISLKEALSTVDGEKTTKWLGNLPSNICTPLYLSKQAKEIESLAPEQVTVKTIEGVSLKEKGLRGYYAVGQGSHNESVLSIIEYRGGQSSDAPVVLVGKGITFDSGGISIKPSSNMDQMKYDMSGAGSVIGIMKAVVQLALPLNIVGCIAAAENMPGGGSYKPGDIYKMHSGHYVEIINTDAEGRLVLADVLSYAEKTYEPELIIDMATLTGACVVALGSSRAGLFTNNPTLQKKLEEAANDSGDWVWPLPLDKIYKDQLASSVADLINSGGREAGASSAASFLQTFVEKTPWAHLDIAGVAYSSGKNTKATGRPVRLLMEFLIQHSLKK